MVVFINASPVFVHSTNHESIGIYRKITESESRSIFLSKAA